MITRCTYCGTQMQNVPVGPLMHAFAEAIGTRMNFGALSVDKPGRRTSASRTPRAIMMLGINPLVTGLGW